MITKANTYFCVSMISFKEIVAATCSSIIPILGEPSNCKTVQKKDLWKGDNLAELTYMYFDSRSSFKTHSFPIHANQQLFMKNMNFLSLDVESARCLFSILCWNLIMSATRNQKIRKGHSITSKHETQPDWCNHKQHFVDILNFFFDPLFQKNRSVQFKFKEPWKFKFEESSFAGTKHIRKLQY